MLDENGTIIYVNDRWLEKTGYERDEVIGKYFRNFLLKEDSETVKSKFPRLKDYGFIRNVPFQIMRKDGIAVEVVLNGISVYDEDGHFVNTRCELKTIDYFVKTNKYIQDLFEEEKFLKEVIHEKSQMNNALIYSTDLKEFLNRILITVFESGKILDTNILTVDIKDKISILSASDSSDVLGPQIKEIITKEVFLGNLNNDFFVLEKDNKISEFENIQELLKEGDIFVIMSTVPENRIKTKKVVMVLYLNIEKPELFKNKWIVFLKDMASIISLGLNTFEMYEKTQMMIETLPKDFINSDLNNYENIRFEDILSKEIERYHRYSTPFSIVVFNVNNLKKISAVIGEFFLEQVLEKLPRLINKNLRGLDQAFRVDNDKFTIMLPETKEKEALRTSKRINDLLSEMEIKSEKLICSFAVTECRKEDTFDIICDRVENILHESQNMDGENLLPC
jgi:diguanylate cyclase (GGDEF)-like protein/PAS domain S-box-containing protein